MFTNTVTKGLIITNIWNMIKTVYNRQYNMIKTVYIIDSITFIQFVGHSQFCPCLFHTLIWLIQVEYHVLWKG